MVAETHQLGGRVSAEDILDFLAVAVGAPSDDAGAIELRDLALDDELAMLHLGRVVADEFGERALVAVEDLDDAAPATLGALAQLFCHALGTRRSIDDD